MVHPDDDSSADRDEADYVDDHDRCESCGKRLTAEEKSRYQDELFEWQKKHTGAVIDERMLPSQAHFEVRRDCNGGAVERVRMLKRIAERTTFFDRAVAGGPEGFVLAAIGIAVLVVIAFAGRH